jgi:hypothetical protein
MPVGGPLPTLTISYAGFVNGDTTASLTTPATIASPPGAYPITVAGATSGNYTITFFNGTLTVNSAPPVINGTLTASGTVGSAFTYTITATNSPTSYGATGLPGGLSVNTTNGVISGTPSAAGTTSVTLSATNASGPGTATLLLTVANGAGDVDGNNVVNSTDLMIVVTHFGNAGGAGDANGDGVVNAFDLMLVVVNFGKVY